MKELRELDAWLWVNVPGLKSCKCVNGMVPKWDKSDYARIREIGRQEGMKMPETEPDIPCSHSPHYSTDPAAAMEVLRKCAEKTFPTVYKSRQADEWCVDNQTLAGRKTHLIVTAETLELAIALFSKKLFT